MKRFLLLYLLLFGFSFLVPVFSQDLDEEMINAQLRFIKENARLTKKEYQRFAKIYLEYNVQLYELNKEQMQKAVANNNSQGNPFPGMMPFGPGRDMKETNEYMKRWNEINSSYLKKLEDNLPDSTREKIGIAQWELGQRIWKQWAEQNKKIMAEQMEEIRKRNEQMWNQMSLQQKQWWQNYWKQWPAPDTSGSQNDKSPQMNDNQFWPGWGNQYDMRERFWGDNEEPLHQWAPLK